MFVFNDILVHSLQPAGDGLWSVSFISGQSGKIKQTIGPRIEKVMAAALSGMMSAGARFLKKSK